MKYFEELMKKISDKNCVVGVIGLGYVGLPLTLRLVEEKIKVIGFDIDTQKVEKLNKKESYILGISDELLHLNSANFTATSNFEALNHCDAIIICVPTPLNEYNEPNLDSIKHAVSLILQYSKKGQLVSLESTTYPGTTEEIIRPSLENHGYKIGDNFFLVYSPERLNPGSKNFNTKSVPKICGGTTEKCLALGVKLYGNIVDKVVPMSSTKAAEMTKLLENIHRAVNIGLVNEMKIISDKMNIDINEVIDAASTKPFGFVPYQPGPGLGGHCIPIDPYYLTWKAKELGHHSYFIELASEINRQMPRYVVEKLIDALNIKKLSIHGAKILILGAAYKKNIDDIRESPSLEIIKLLSAKDFFIDYSDPYILKLTIEINNTKKEMKSVSLDQQSLKSYDAIILVTDHDIFDYELIARNSKLIIDTRDKFKNLEKVIKA